MKKLRIAFAGGGTAGHLYPALNLAREFEKSNSCEFLFFGTKRGIECQKVPENGFKLVLLNVRGLQRRISVQNLLFPFRLLASMITCKKALRQFNPDLVIGTGGYVMGPVLKMAVSLNIPVFIQEQNSFPGVSTRMLAKDAKTVFLAYPGAADFLSKETKTIVCGNPVNKLEIDKNENEIFKSFGLDERLKTILVFGGSQGAENINNAMLNILKKNGLPEDVQVLWQCGKLQYENIKNQLDLLQTKKVSLKAFINDMWSAYKISNFAVCRAGAMSISELALAGLPSILIPLKIAAGNHQHKNALEVEKAGGGVLIEDNENLADNLKVQISSWIVNPKKMEAMKNNITKLTKPDAARMIVEKIKKEIGI
jgi:UDP-N-acetylglucosamine--N-acetylmuramyl-(pentapeptide) pyrophosphoryl-undecaprenol N-acetylglucosamine transferase